MGSCRVKAEKVVVCKDLMRRSAWRVGMHLPIDQEQFEIIERIIRSLRNIMNSYLTVNLELPLQRMTYLQTCRDNENLWRVELHFEQPDIFTYERDGKWYIRRHPWTQKQISVSSVEEVIHIFREVLCENRIPDLSDWRNNTGEIYMKQFRRRKKV